MDQAGVSLGAAYKALELNPGATLNQVKAAYKRLALKCHPDMNPADPAEFHRLSAAYQRIINKAPNEELQFDASQFRTSTASYGHGHAGSSRAGEYRQANRRERMPIMNTIFARPMTVGLIATIGFAFCGGIVIAWSHTRQDRRRMGVFSRDEDTSQ